jgi:hypothetical protein
MILPRSLEQDSFGVLPSGFQVSYPFRCPVKAASLAAVGLHDFGHRFSRAH